MADETVLRIVQETETGPGTPAGTGTTLPAAPPATLPFPGPGTAPGTALPATVLPRAAGAGASVIGGGGPGGAAGGGLLASLPAAMGPLLVALGAVAAVAAIVTAGLAAVVLAVAKFDSALQGIAADLVDLGGDLALAQAANEIRNLQARLDRAERLGDPLGRFIEARGEIDAQLEEIKTDLLKPLVPIAADAAQILSQMLQAIRPITTAISNIDPDQILEVAIRAALGPLNVQILKATGLWTRMADALDDLTTDDQLGPGIQRELDAFIGGGPLPFAAERAFPRKGGRRGVL